MCGLSSRERERDRPENKRGLPVYLWDSMDGDVGKSKNRMRSGIIGIAKITREVSGFAWLVRFEIIL